MGFQYIQLINNKFFSDKQIFLKCYNISMFQNCWIVEQQYVPKTSQLPILNGFQILFWALRDPF